MYSFFLFWVGIYTTDIFRTWMHFPRVNVTLYDTVNIIHDVSRTAHPFPHTAKFIIVGVRNNKIKKNQKLKMNRIRTYCCLISKISNSVGRKDNFLAKARKVSFMPTELDMFDIPQHYILILYVYIPTAIKNASQKIAISFCLFNKGGYFSWYVVIIHQTLLDIAEKTRCRYPYHVPTQIIPLVKKIKTTSWTFGEALLMAVGIHVVNSLVPVFA